MDIYLFLRIGGTDQLVHLGGGGGGLFFIMWFYIFSFRVSDISKKKVFYTQGFCTHAAVLIMNFYF